MLRVVLTLLTAVDADVLTQILIYGFVVASLDHARSQRPLASGTHLDINLSSHRYSAPVC